MLCAFLRKSSQKEDARALRRILFLTAFVIDFLRFGGSFLLLVAEVPRRDSILASLLITGLLG